MLEKLLLAVTITFSLNLFLGVSSPNTNTTASTRLGQTRAELVRLLSEQGWRANNQQLSSRDS